MDKNGHNEDDGNSGGGKNYAKYTGVAFQMMAIIGLFAFIGYELDAHFKHQTQWVTALCCIIGVCLSIYQTVRQLNK